MIQLFKRFANVDLQVKNLERDKISPQNQFSNILDKVPSDHIVIIVFNSRFYHTMHSCNRLLTKEHNKFNQCCYFMSSITQRTEISSIHKRLCSDKRDQSLSKI